MSDEKDIEFDTEYVQENNAHEKLLEKNKKLKEELKQCKKERQEYLDGWQRLRADVANKSKDERASAERTENMIREEIISDIIPILDSFDMAMGSENWNTVDMTWRKGIEHIRAQCMEMLEKHGIAAFGKVGEQFDPEIHEAVKEVGGTKEKQHTIVRIIRFGYKIGETLLRPAQVIIAM
jgi:molecular chaperone GrpE